MVIKMRIWFSILLSITFVYLSIGLTPIDGKHFPILMRTQFRENDWLIGDPGCNQILYTNDKSDLNKSDVLLFHWKDVDTKDILRTDQKWVLSNWESPEHSPKEPIINDINWFMTYKNDSYIYVYECQRQWNNEDLFDKMTKSVVSNFNNTPNKMEEFVVELKMYTDVDVYGKYENKTCGNTCFTDIGSDYKFYLSFENSLCRDYVTEKLFRILQFDIIPVFYGSADYRQISPKNSYIDVFNFLSIKEFSDYLKDMSRDKELYNSYHKWKATQCVDRMKTRNNEFCELDHKLKETNYSQQKIRRALIQLWFNEGKCQIWSITTYGQKPNTKLTSKPLPNTEKCPQWVYYGTLINRLMALLIAFVAILFSVYNL